MRTIAVVGASLAGLRSAEELRGQGFDGRIVVIGDERHAPYDRPPLSKLFLAGEVSFEEISLTEQSSMDELDAEWLLGVRAAQLHPRAGAITLSDGRQIHTDAVVIATGGRARTLPGSHGLRGVHTLRTADDATALRADLTSDTPRVVVIGAGWIGAEVASTCRQLGLEVTIVEANQAPLARTLGSTMGRLCAELHSDHGVKLLLGNGVYGLTRSEDPAGPRVTGVVLADGSELPAEVVVVGTGMRPVTEWLTGSGITVDDGVVCDPGCVTEIPSVVAVGDVARYRGTNDRLVRHEHWTNAYEQPATAIRNLLAGATIDHYRSSGYMWSEQYGIQLQFAGETTGADDVDVVDGSPDDRRFVATYRRNGASIGVLAMNNPKLFGRIRRQLSGPVMDSTA